MLKHALFAVSCCLLTFLPVFAEGPDRPVVRGRQFLASLFDQQLSLLPEYPGSTTYWLYHDNYLAAKVLAASHPRLSTKILATIREYGVDHSGKIEILFGEADRALPFRHFDLTVVDQRDDKVIRTERLTNREMDGWEAYADLQFLAAIALSEAKPEIAEGHFRAGLQMWDGLGFADPATQKLKVYSTYKLALAVCAADRLRLHNELPEGLSTRLHSLQNSAGGWVTDYLRDGTPHGQANVETTCLAILALESTQSVKRQEANP